MADDGKPPITPDLVRLHLSLTFSRGQNTRILVLGLMLSIICYGQIALQLAINSAPRVSFLIALLGLFLVTAGFVSQQVIGRQLVSKYPYVQGQNTYIVLLCIVAPTIGALTWMVLVMLLASEKGTFASLTIFLPWIMGLPNSAVYLQVTLAISGFVRRYGTAALMPLWHVQLQQVEQQVQYLEQFRISSPASPPHASIPQQPTLPTQ